jgi:ferredoxin
MKIQVDSTKCDAYGLCAEKAPHLFELDDFGYATASHGGIVAPADADLAREAVDVCPAGAIRILDQ